MPATNMKKFHSISTAEAFYRSFCALSKNEKRTVTRYIMEDEEVHDYFKIPNEATLQALAEDKKSMPVFHSIDALREDLLM